MLKQFIFITDRSIAFWTHVFEHCLAASPVYYGARSLHALWFSYRTWWTTAVDVGIDTSAALTIANHPVPWARHVRMRSRQNDGRITTLCIGSYCLQLCSCLLPCVCIFSLSVASYIFVSRCKGRRGAERHKTFLSPQT